MGECCIKEGNFSPSSWEFSRALSSWWWPNPFWGLVTDALSQAPTPSLPSSEMVARRSFATSSISTLLCPPFCCCWATGEDGESVFGVETVKNNYIYVMLALVTDKCMLTTIYATHQLTSFHDCRRTVHRCIYTHAYAKMHGIHFISAVNSAGGANAAGRDARGTTAVNGIRVGGRNSKFVKLVGGHHDGTASVSHNATFIHGLLCFSNPVTVTSCKMFGRFYHPLITHTPILFRITSMRSINIENQGRVFG